MIHHLQKVEKYATISEIYRVLQPGGTFLLLDIENQEYPPNSKNKAGDMNSLSSIVKKDDMFSKVLNLGYDKPLIGKIGYYKAIK